MLNSCQCLWWFSCCFVINNIANEHFQTSNDWWRSISTKRLAAVVQMVDNASNKSFIQWISVNKTIYAIHWIVIYLVDSVIHPLNNWAVDIPQYCLALFIVILIYLLIFLIIFLCKSNGQFLEVCWTTSPVWKFFGQIPNFSPLRKE